MIKDYTISLIGEILNNKPEKIIKFNSPYPEFQNKIIKSIIQHEDLIILQYNCSVEKINNLSFVDLTKLIHLINNVY